MGDLVWSPPPSSQSLQRCAELGRRGGGPGWWEPFWLAGVPGAQVLAGDLGHGGGVVAGERLAVSVTRVSLADVLCPV